MEINIIISVVSLLITAICSLVGAVIGSTTKSKTIDLRLQNIEKSVEEINPILSRQNTQSEQIKEINRRLDLIERKIYCNG